MPLTQSYLNENLLHVLNQLNSSITLTDLDSNFCLINQATANLINISIDKAIGISYENINCDAVKRAEYYKKQDELVIQNNKTLKILSLQCSGHSSDMIFSFGAKKPLLDANGKMIGTIGEFTNISNILSPKLFSHCVVFKCLSGNKVQQFEVVIDDIYRNLNLSKRQSEVFFFLLRSKSTKEIANILRLSSRTVESHIENIKYKLGCSNKKQIIEKGIESGSLGLLPEKLYNMMKNTHESTI